MFLNFLTTPQQKIIKNIEYSKTLRLPRILCRETVLKSSVDHEMGNAIVRQIERKQYH